MPKRSKIMEEVGQIIQQKHFNKKTEMAYMDWIYRFIIYNNDKYPGEMGKKEIARFLTFLAHVKNASLSTQYQALNAIVFLYKDILKLPVKNTDFKLVNPGKRLPLVLSRSEVYKILSYLDREKRLMASLLYGSGLRLMECLKLRIKDIDFGQREIIVTNEKGNVDRKTILPNLLAPQLKRQIEKARFKFEENLLVNGFSGATVADTLEIKYPETLREIKWQFIFPSDKCIFDSDSGKYTQHHRHESYLQKAVKDAVGKAQIKKKVSCKTFRHTFAAHLLEDGYDIHIVQTLLGHKDVRSTMIYNRVLNRNRLNVRSPIDLTELQ